MKRYIVFLLIPLCIAAILPCRLNAVDVVLNDAPAKVFFSPDGGAARGILREIGQATREVLVQAYLFTSRPIQSALLKAQKRGVNVEVILDKNVQKDSRYITAKALRTGGVTVWLDDRHANAHNKIVIIDRETVITGSFNFTYAAESKNAENVLIIRSQNLAGHYTDNFLNHRRHSRKY